MKVIFALIVFCISTILGDVAPYPPSGWKPTRALLVLPPQNPPQSDATPQPVQEETENLDKLNDNVMERLRQEFGSDTGVYYVYLPDGRLQRVQYTTAPIRQQQTQQFQPQPGASQQSSQYSQNQANQPGTTDPQGSQQSNYQIVFGTNKPSNQRNQQQYNRYQAQQQSEESRFQEYAQSQPNQEQKQQDSNSTKESGNPNQILAQYNQPKQQNVPATSYVASVQFTDVPPITGPIFAYSPSPLVRIVRYAGNYQ